MEKLIKNFPNQLKEALQIGEKAQFTNTSNNYENIVICGLGGSGIGGSLINDIVFNEIKKPISVVKSYFLPAFANENTLVIISSYSGNTEETVAAMQEALKRNCKIVAVTSGGKVEEICKQNNLDHIIIPGGFPPRACLGYSTTQLFFILNSFGFIKSNYTKELSNSLALLENEQENIKKSAKELAEKLINKLPILYAANNFEAVAIRFRQQINENSKMLCWHHVVPEMNHNELVGWRIKDEHQAVVFLRNEDDFARIQERIELNKQIISKNTSNIYEIWSKGNSMLEKAMYLIHFGDWVSLYLSYLRGVDTTEVNVIDFLKGELAKK